MFVFCCVVSNSLYHRVSLFISWGSNFIKFYLSLSWCVRYNIRRNWFLDIRISTVFGSVTQRVGFSRMFTCKKPVMISMDDQELTNLYDSVISYSLSTVFWFPLNHSQVVSTGSALECISYLTMLTSHLVYIYCHSLIFI